MREYLPRITDAELTERLHAFGGVLIVGPKWCGKTTTAMQQAASVLELQDPDSQAGYLVTASTKPSLLLKGDSPRLLDEWQIAPVLWDAARVEIDRRQEVGQFILTGSTSVDNDSIMHTGTGRISRLRMYPMSLFESMESNGAVSLRELFDNPETDIDGAPSGLTIEELIFAVCRGGWPSALNVRGNKRQLLIAKDYLENICQSDVSTVDGTSRNPSLARAILRSYARNLSMLAKKSTIIEDVRASSEGITAPTLDSYLNALQRIYVVEDLTAWSPAIRSATAIRTGAKRELVDPSIAVAVLGLTPAVLEQDMKTLGFLFENLCVRDLRVYAQGLGGSLSHYHDRLGLEVDIVLLLDDGRFALVECKLGSRDIEEGAQHLKKVRDLIREHKSDSPQNPLRDPDLLLVLTGGNMAYSRPDGVKVVPIGCLRD